MPPTEPALIAAVDIPRVGSTMRIEFGAGTSIVLLGPNGAGKTRLGVLIEQGLGERALRIGAHRSLAMNTEVPSKSLDAALKHLRYGIEHFSHRPVHREALRWSNEPATKLLSDFDQLIVALYAEQADVSVNHVMRVWLVRYRGLNFAD